MEVLSEHCCHGWLEGYTLTGRHGCSRSYEAFAMIIDSMAMQHGKWIEHARAGAMARTDPVVQLPADLDLLAQRP